MRRWVVVTGFLLLAGCGQSGDLYLPDDPAPAQPAPVQDPATPPPTTGSTPPPPAPAQTQEKKE